MKLVTIADGTRNGRLHLVSRDGQRVLQAEAAKTLQDALENWDSVHAALAAFTVQGDVDARLKFLPI